MANFRMLSKHHFMLVDSGFCCMGNYCILCTKLCYPCINVRNSMMMWTHLKLTFKPGEYRQKIN